MADVYVSYYSAYDARPKITGPFDTYGQAAAWASFSRLDKPMIVRPESPVLTPEEKAALELLGKRYIEPEWR
jgi:hypothetical protein